MQPVIENEPSYVFNTREFKENSVISSVLTLNYGVVSVMVRGNSARSILQPFTPLKLSLNPSKTDLYFLGDYECCGESYNFKLPILFCATYLNELLYNLYHSKEANPLLFGTYVATLDALQQQKHIEQYLRLFELALLESLGYGLSSVDQNGQPLQAKQLYRFGIGMGFIPVNTPQPKSSSKQAFLQTISELNAAAAQAQVPSPALGSALGQAQGTDRTSVAAPSPISAQIAAFTTTTTTSSSANTAITANLDHNPASRWSDEELEEAMRFSKRKVKGPKFETRQSSSAFNMSQYSGVITPDGRPIGLSELLGPALSGDVLTRIVKRSFDSDTLKQSKQLTNALFQFLLGKREIKSRQLYRDYLQMQAQGKASGATPTALSTNAQAAILNTAVAATDTTSAITATTTTLTTCAAVSNSNAESLGSQAASATNLESAPVANASAVVATTDIAVQAKAANTAITADATNAAVHSANTKNVVSDVDMLAKTTVSPATTGDSQMEASIAAQVGASIEVGKVLQDKSALVEAALKEEQLQLAAQKKSRRKTQTKSKAKAKADNAVKASEEGSAKAAMAAMAGNGKTVKDDASKATKPAKTAKAAISAQALPGDVQLEPSANLLESAAKAQADLVSKLEADKDEKLAKKRKSRASSTKRTTTTKSTKTTKSPKDAKTAKNAKTAKDTQDTTQVKDLAVAQDKTYA